MTTLGEPPTHLVVSDRDRPERGRPRVTPNRLRSIAARRLKTPPGEVGIAALRRLGRDPLVRTLSVTEKVAALLTSRRCFTEVRHDSQKPGT